MLAMGGAVGPRARAASRVDTPARRVRSALIILSWAYVAAAIAIAGVMWGLGDRWWPATVLLFMGRWIFLLPLALLLPAALLLRPRLVVPLAFGAAIILGPVMGMRTGWRRLLPRPDGMPLRVVTFNTGGGQVVAAQLPTLLADWGADVVLFQECGAALSSASERVPGWLWHHGTGLCLMTRLPIAAAEPMDRSALEAVKQSGAGIGGSGAVVRYTLTTARGPLSVTNLHLETPRKGFEGLMSGDVERLRMNTELRDIESRLARAWVNRGRAPALVAGDFNTPVESRTYREHWGAFANAFSHVGVGPGATKYNGWIRVRIDHVLSDNEWRAVRVRRWSAVGSDHRPVVADLVLKSR